MRKSVLKIGVHSALNRVGLTALCMHFGSSKVVPYVATGAHHAVTAVQSGLTPFGSMTELVFSNAFHAHPDLKVAYSEGRIGWFPLAIQRLDQVWETYRHCDLDPKINTEIRPSEIVRRNIGACFIDDLPGVRQRHQISVDRLLWESDYPHSGSLWPNSRSNAEKVFTDVPTEEVRQIVETDNPIPSCLYATKVKIKVDKTFSALGDRRPNASSARTPIGGTCRQSPDCGYISIPIQKGELCTN